MEFCHLHAESALNRVRLSALTNMTGTNNENYLALFTIPVGATRASLL